MHNQGRKYIGSLILTGCFWCFYPHFATAQLKPAILKKQSIEQKLDDVGKALASEDLARAEMLLREILSVSPRNVTAQSLAGIVADRKNDLVAAEKHFALAAKLAPKSPETRNNYGAILLRLSRKSEAAREFTASLAANPNQPSALINLAQIRFDENNLQEARRLFEKAKAIQPDTEILRALLIISLNLKETDRAKHDFQEYFSSAENSTNQTARGEIGSVLLKNGLIAEAIQELETALAFEPNNINIIILLSRAYLRQKNIKSAGRVLESAAARGIDDAKIYAALADVYQAGNYYENAVPAMRLAIERDRSNEHYRFRYGMLLIDAKAPPAAVIRLKEAVSEFPNSAKIWLGLGIAQYHDSKLTDATQSLEKALSLDPHLMLAFPYLAFIKNVEGNSVEAAEQFKRALVIDPDNAVLHYLLADTLLKIASSDVGQIERHLRRAVELDPSLGSAYLGLGKIYARQKRFPEAAAALEKTIQLEPQRTEAFYQLGQVYARLKRSDESRVILAKFKELSEQEKTQTKTEYIDFLRRLANVSF